MSNDKGGLKNTNEATWKEKDRMRTRREGGVFKIHLPLSVAGEKRFLSRSRHLWWPSFPKDTPPVQKMGSYLWDKRGTYGSSVSGDHQLSLSISPWSGQAGPCFSSTPPRACLLTRLMVRQDHRGHWGHPLPGDWELSQKWHLDCYHAQWVVGTERAGHWSWNLPVPRECQSQQSLAPSPQSPWPGNRGRRERTRTAAVSWQVSRSLPKCSVEAGHSPITATLTAAQILGRQPQLHPHRAKVSTTHLGDWQEGRPGCPAKDGFSTCSWIQNRFPQPEIRNRVRAGRPVFHHLGFLAFRFATKARFPC